MGSLSSAVSVYCYSIRCHLSFFIWNHSSFFFVCLEFIVNVGLVCLSFINWRLSVLPLKSSIATFSFSYIHLFLLCNWFLFYYFIIVICLLFWILVTLLNVQKNEIYFLLLCIDCFGWCQSNLQCPFSW